MAHISKKVYQATDSLNFGLNNAKVYNPANLGKLSNRYSWLLNEDYDSNTNLLNKLLSSLSFVGDDYFYPKSYSDKTEQNIDVIHPEIMAFVSERKNAIGIIEINEENEDAIASTIVDTYLPFGVCLCCFNVLHNCAHGIYGFSEEEIKWHKYFDEHKRRSEIAKSLGNAFTKEEMADFNNYRSDLINSLKIKIKLLTGALKASRDPIETAVLFEMHDMKDWEKLV
jgi:hypothetical protein